MIDLVDLLMAWMQAVGLALAVSMACVLTAGRAAIGCHELRRRQVERRYGPVLRKALGGDAGALHALATSPPRHRVAIAWLLLPPLIGNRDPDHIAQTRRVADAMALVPLADRFLRSRWWWRRALGLRALGLMQASDRTASIIAALDDRNADVRGAALDALSDLRDPASLPAIIVRLHDASLHRGRRAAALAAFGSDCEPFLLELAEVDQPHRLNYARALAICGTSRARAALCEWTHDPRAEVRAGAFEALAHVGLDAHAARLAIGALESRDVQVRAMAALALRGWTGPGVATCLVRHLDDSWVVALRAAQALRSMPDTGLRELYACASRPGLAGLLARQMLWEVDAPS